MSAIEATAGVRVVPPPSRLTPVDVVSDTWVICQRNLRVLTRNPMLMVFATVQPVMFVILFRYVFGGAIGQTLPFGIEYIDFLMPGIFVQTTAFGAINTGVGLATDMQEGFIDRFRALPMARSAVLGGRTASDLVRTLFVVILMTVVGWLVGFRIHGGLDAYLLAIVLLLLFAFALSWAFALIGLKAPNAEAAQAAAFPILMPLTFASSAFVPTDTMPDWLAAFAEHQPVTAVVNAVRALCLGLPADEQSAFLGKPTGELVFIALVWCIGITAVFAPLAIQQYKRVS
jgi:ABC transporter DrrB family efflux protein